jgi:hypothetical protein
VFRVQGSGEEKTIVEAEVGNEEGVDVGLVCGEEEDGAFASGFECALDFFFLEVYAKGVEPTDEFAENIGECWWRRGMRKMGGGEKQVPPSHLLFCLERGGDRRQQMGDSRQHSY